LHFIMWENLVRRIRPGRPQPESTDVHAAHAPDAKHAGRGVEMGDPGADTGNFSQEMAARRARERKEREGGLPRHARDEGRRLRCPNCRADMRYELLGSVEIDRCPECGGVFLDRGELAELTGEEQSSYLPQSRSGGGQSVLVYTPHGLSNHVRESEQEHERGYEPQAQPKRYDREA